MELVSASKMRRALHNTQVLRDYALLAWEILERIASAHPGAHPFLEKRPVSRVLCVFYSTDRGLCGNLNAQLFRFVMQYLSGLKNLKGFESADFIALGKKGQQFLSRTGANVIAAFGSLTNHPVLKDVFPLEKMVMDLFLEKKYDQVVLIYPDCVSALSQLPTAKVVLPLTKGDLDKMIESMGAHRFAREKENKELKVAEYLFEPTQDEILRAVVPQLTEVQIYQALLESAASEHSARMIAMRNASDNASDLIDDLTLAFNQKRQANITAELAEISSSKEAMADR